MYFSTEKKAEIKAFAQHKALRLKREARYSIPCEGGTRRTQPTSVRTFDKEGSIIEESTFAAMGKLKQRQEYVYDSLGHKVKIKYYNRFNELYEIKQFDEQGYFTQSVRLLAQGRTRKKHSEITYNTQNYIQEKKAYDYNERLLSHSRYDYYPDHVLKQETHIYYNIRSPLLQEKRRTRKKYNKKGTLILDYLATPKDTLLHTHTHQYNHEDLLAETHMFDAQGQLVGRKHYIYTKNKELLQSKMAWLDPTGHEKESYVEHYSHHKQLEALIHYNEKGQELSSKRYQYNSQGLLIRTEHYKRSPKRPNKTSCFVYEYTFY